MVERSLRKFIDMEIKISSVIVAIVALFIVKISLEASFDSSKKTVSPIERTPASIDEGYEIQMNGTLKKSQK